MAPIFSIAATNDIPKCYPIYTWTY